MVNLSVLDLAYIGEGFTPADALANARDLAQHAEAAGYERFWLAEHHNLAGIASAATAVCIGHVAGGTKTIRVGAGGIMLPNHSPMVVAEQFGTLATLFPGRIDLGLGRAPGTDQRTLQALRRGPDSSENFPQDVVELQALLGAPQENQAIHAIPGEDTNVPLWILGSSLFGAQLAAMLGLPYAFASHFAPQALMQAVEIYRDRFEPSAQLDAPYVMIGCNAVVADTEDEARHLFTTPQQQFTRMVRGTRGQLPPPVDDIETFWSPMEKSQASSMLGCSFYGSSDTIKARLDPLIEATGADELMVVGAIWDHAARVRSYEILAEAMS
ncbi:MAG: LLM class flavin-dependent oxidoreductase [Rhodospirillaceae bacterium]|jgi:luciferase family oxidoreductase group 1|nr:LLM class flavin-dependent oxidoreductase [Rhodospirillaceae bacterium]MBT5944468.1 LLM class flavin-dependent oxidoreductase [Rhodospirillaceae bacterium]MBT6405207.1 LLM class flavin-dependent oxidoreductase [Rhodospirillaceae bacterium]MBT6537464.1 LLM class flavin-dependent oxidoreductase [Rhodospirillaceae bacterium]MBT7361638.1 LLM class flavin-dependent oxidoreductase [Rhodospirillaceae bacterium]